MKKGIASYKGFANRGPWKIKDKLIHDVWNSNMLYDEAVDELYYIERELGAIMLVNLSPAA